MRVFFFPPGKRGVGGRASSRAWPSAADTVDHAAQFFLADTEAFQGTVAGWAEQGLVRPWDPSTIGRFTSPGASSSSSFFEPFDDGKTRWIGGAGGLAAHLAQGLAAGTVQNNVWVSPTNGLRKNSDGSWSLRVNGKEIGRHGKGVCPFRVAPLRGPKLALFSLEQL